MDAALEAVIREMPLPTEAERKREALVGRLASALEDMGETLPAEHPVRRSAIHWKDREDFEQLLDAWEAGRYPAGLSATG